MAIKVFLQTFSYTAICLQTKYHESKMCSSTDWKLVLGDVENLCYVFILQCAGLCFFIYIELVCNTRNEAATYSNHLVWSERQTGNNLYVYSSRQWTYSFPQTYTKFPYWKWKSVNCHQHLPSVYIFLCIFIIFIIIHLIVCYKDNYR